MKEGFRGCCCASAESVRHPRNPRLIGFLGVSSADSTSLWLPVPSRFRLRGSPGRGRSLRARAACRPARTAPLRRAAVASPSTRDAVPRLGVADVVDARRRSARSRRTAPGRTARARRACSAPRSAPAAARRPSARRESRSPLCGSGQRAMSPAAKMPGALVSRNSLTTIAVSIVSPAASASAARGAHADADHDEIRRETRPVVEHHRVLLDALRRVLRDGS